VPADTRPDLQRAAQRLRDTLEARTEEASTQITRSWLVAQQRIDLEVQALLSKMEAARLAGIDPSPAWLYQERRLAALTDAIGDQVADWARTAEPAIRDLAYAAAAQASQGAKELAREAARVDLPGVEASFTDLAPENMATILGHLAPGGPLRDLLVSLGPETAEAAAQTLLQGVLLGKGSDWIAKGLGQALDIPRWRAETIARTEALRAYRETSRETYKKSNVVGQWEWNAALDRRTCPACVALHGSLFSLDEQLDGHPRCRCAMVPVTKTWAELGMDPALDEMNPRVPTETGPEWLKRQTPQTQRAVLGPGKYDLYANGKADLPDFVARTHNDRWGTMRRERSLKELAEGRNADYRDVTPDAPAPTPDDFDTLLDDLFNLGDQQRAAQAAADATRPRGPVGPGSGNPGWEPSWPTTLVETAEEARDRANPYYGTGPEWSNNCTNCTSAWELRRRGYDVTAQPLATGRQWDATPTTWRAEVFDVKTMNQAEKGILSTMPDGARGGITVQWRSGGAHIFNWEVVDGRVVWVDAQTGRTPSLESLKERVKQSRISWFRMDDRPLLPALSVYVQ
jgi:SPP1 gp7 family putative phage head morphogenesis protein